MTGKRQELSVYHQVLFCNPNPEIAVFIFLAISSTLFLSPGCSSMILRHAIPAETNGGGSDVDAWYIVDLSLTELINSLLPAIKPPYAPNALLMVSV